MKRHGRFRSFLSSRVAPWSLIFAAGLTWRIWLAYRFPAWSGWDGFERLWVRDSNLFVRHWLPLPQLLVALVAAGGGSVAMVRWTFAIFSCGASVAFGLAAARLTQRRDLGLLAALLLAFMPTWTRYSMAPYQEAPFFLFFALAIWAWARGFENERPSVLWFGGICLALAGLCRYEAWMVAAIIGAGALYRKQFQGLAYLSLAIIVAAVWAATSATRTCSYGPLAAHQPVSAHAFAQPFSEMWHSACIASGRLVEYMCISWVGVGVLLVAGGIHIAARQKGLFGREMIVILAMFVGVAFARLSLSGITTDRMGLLAAAFGLLYLSMGLIALGDRWGRIPSHAIAGIMLYVFMFQGYGVAQLGSSWAPEADAARQLLAVPEGVNVRIEPREIPNQLGESAVVAIFGHSFELDHQEPRWIYQTRNGWSSSRKAEQILFWDNGRYELSAASSPEVEQSLGERPPRSEIETVTPSRADAGGHASNFEYRIGES